MLNNIQHFVFILYEKRVLIVQPLHRSVRKEMQSWFEMKETHSSHCRSRVSLTRSLKHPREYMLSNTSGSSSVRDKIRLTHTRLGGGCSGQGSLRPPLLETHTREGAREHAAMGNAAMHGHRIKHIMMSRGCKWVFHPTTSLLTDTRRVSGWPLAVRGDRADGAIISSSLLWTRWPKSCVVQTVHTLYIFTCASYGVSLEHRTTWTGGVFFNNTVKHQCKQTILEQGHLRTLTMQ